VVFFFRKKKKKEQGGKLKSPRDHMDKKKASTGGGRGKTRKKGEPVKTGSLNRSRVRHIARGNVSVPGTKRVEKKLRARQDFRREGRGGDEKKKVGGKALERRTPKVQQEANGAYRANRQLGSKKMISVGQKERGARWRESKQQATASIFSTTTVGK